jgi:hypothetical protein
MVSYFRRSWYDVGGKINARNAQKALRGWFIKIDAVKATRCLAAYINVSYIHTFVLHGWILCTAAMPVVLLGTAEFLENRSSKCCTLLTGVNQITDTFTCVPQNRTDARPFKMGPTGCPETSSRNYHYTLSNSTGERISQPHGAWK